MQRHWPALAASFCMALPAHAQAPAFDVAWRAWDTVTRIARHNGLPARAGECGATFRPFVIPGLRRQTREEEDAAAVACVAAARASCADARLRRTPELARQCEEFR